MDGMVGGICRGGCMERMDALREVSREGCMEGGMMHGRMDAWTEGMTDGHGRMDAWRDGYMDG